MYYISLLSPYYVLPEAAIKFSVFTRKKSTSKTLHSYFVNEIVYLFINTFIAN